MALVGVGVQVIPLMGAAIFLPSAMATALRIHTPSSSERKIENDRETDAYWAAIKSDDNRRMTVDFQKDSQDYWKKLWPVLPPRHPSQEDYEDGDDEDEDADDESRGRPFGFVGSTESPRQRPMGSLDTWSVVWYCGMFAAFTSLFLIMPCSQVLCKAGLAAARRDPRLRPRPPLLPPSHQMHYGTPPPSYKQFAPPPYESLFDLNQAAGPHLEKAPVYIIPLRGDDAPPPPPPPPAYSEAMGNSLTAPAATPTPAGMSPSVA